MDVIDEVEWKTPFFFCLVDELLCIRAEKAGLPDCLVGLFVKAIS